MRLALTLLGCASASCSFAPLAGFARTRVSSPAMSEARPRGLDAAIDTLTSFVAAATVAVSVGAETWTTAMLRLDEKRTIDVTATTTETSTPQWAVKELKHAAPRSITAKVTVLSPKGRKEKELLLSGPHSPLWRPKSADYDTTEDWGI